MTPNHSNLIPLSIAHATIAAQQQAAAHTIAVQAANFHWAASRIAPLLTSSPAVLLQAVVILGDSTTEGQIITAVTIPWFTIIELMMHDPNIIYQLGWRKWEEIIAGAYERAGFDEVTLTPRSGDLGRDVIAVKRGLGTVRIIDQVKAYGPNHLVTADDVRALLGVVVGDKASKGFLTTTSDFAPGLRDDILIKEFMPARLELINGKMLLARLEELAKEAPHRH